MTTVKDILDAKYRVDRACYIIHDNKRIAKFLRWYNLYNPGFIYSIIPIWENYDGAYVPGLPWDTTHLEHYIYIECMPPFYYDRYIPETREDWDDYAHNVGLFVDREKRDSWDLMIYYKGRVFNSDLFVEDFDINIQEAFPGWC